MPLHFFPEKTSMVKLDWYEVRNQPLKSNRLLEQTSSNLTASWTKSPFGPWRAVLQAGQGCVTYPHLIDSDEENEGVRKLGAGMVPLWIPPLLTSAAFFSASSSFSWASLRASEYLSNSSSVPFSFFCRATRSSSSWGPFQCVHRGGAWARTGARATHTYR